MEGGKKYSFIALVVLFKRERERENIKTYFFSTFLGDDASIDGPKCRFYGITSVCRCS